MHLAPTDPARRLNHASLADDRTAPYADARRRHVLTRRRRCRACGVQVAAQLHVGHDDGAPAERDVGSTGDRAAAGDFVAGILGVVLVRRAMI